MKFLKIFYLTAFVVMVTLGVNLLINDTKEENQTYETLQTINTSAVSNGNQFQNFKTFQNPDFTIAAEKTINCVVHVKNTAIARSSNSIWAVSYTHLTLPTNSGV